jgi:lysine 2,3-aminomutase
MVFIMFIPAQTTLYYQTLLDRLGPGHPLHRTVLPIDEGCPGPGELTDPLGEEAHSPCPGLVHTYPDKVLLLATLNCAVYCRYCTRGRLVGTGKQEAIAWRLPDEAINYLQEHSEIRDVLISGGDPLTLSDEELGGLAGRVRHVRHVRTLRMGTKVPAVMPERVTPELATILAKHRVWLQLHVIHPDELTPEMTAALDTLAAAGVPMVSQTVLLKGINDDAGTLADLFYGLLERRVKPYYLFQCDPVTGSSAFRTPVEKGLQIMRELQGRVSGLALPHYCIDAPGGGGKITLLPDSQLRRDGSNLILTNYEGKEYRYPDPVPGSGSSRPAENRRILQ